MAAQKSAAAGMQFSPEEFSKFGYVGKEGGLIADKKWGGYQPSDLDFANIGGMSNKQFRGFKQGLTPAQQYQVFGSEQYNDAYQGYNRNNTNPFQLR